jgi:hypothetical protein
MESNKLLGYLKVSGYLIYAVLLFGYLFLVNYLYLALVRYNSIYFNITSLILRAMPVSYIIFGCLLGLEHIVRQNRKDGVWSVTVVRLIFLGLPSLFFSFYWFLYFIGPLRKPILPAWLPQQFFCLAAVVLGYVLITSFNKGSNLCH